MKQLKHSVSLCALSIALGVAASPAGAQTTPPDQSAAPDVSQATIAAARAGVAGPETSRGEDTDIVVTGTHIVRPNIGSPSPIVTITSEEIKQQGAVNISDVLNRLPQVVPDNQAAYQDSNGAQQVELRGLGFNRTLSLIDGQRIATAEGVNVNAVPVALVERIDVLTGGAAAIYGADAVAGVINFIIKKDYDGLQLNGSYSGYMHDNNGNNLGARTAVSQGIAVPSGLTFDGGTVDISGAVGHHFLDGRLSVSAYGGFTKTNPVKLTDRDYSTCYLTQNGQANTIPSCQTFPNITPFGTFTPSSGANSGLSFSDAKDGSRTFVPTTSSDSYLPFQSNYLLQQYDRYTAGAFLNFAFNDHLKLSGSYMMSDSFSYVLHGPLYSGSAGVSQNVVINCNNPLLSTQQQGIICGTAAGTAATAPLNVKYVPNLTFRDKYENLDQRFAASLHGQFLHDALKFDLNVVISSFDNIQHSSPINSTPSLPRSRTRCWSGAVPARRSASRVPPIACRRISSALTAIARRCSTIGTDRSRASAATMAGCMIIPATRSSISASSASPARLPAMAWPWPAGWNRAATPNATGWMRCSRPRRAAVISIARRR